VAGEKNPDYSRTWFYYIAIGKDKRYYGHSTHKYVSSYEATHRNKYKQALESKNITRKLWKDLHEAGVQPKDMTLTFIEYFPCKDSNEARTREQYLCDTWKGELLNEIRCIVDAETKKREVRERVDKYYQEHTAERKQYAREYHKKHESEIREYRQQKNILSGL
jgi:hypothetical protein